MDYLEKVLEKVKEWARKLIEAILGPEVQPEGELIPIPVKILNVAKLVVAVLRVA